MEITACLVSNEQKFWKSVLETEQTGFLGVILCSNKLRLEGAGSAGICDSLDAARMRVQHGAARLRLDPLVPVLLFRWKNQVKS
jgi:hypothetical protein